jgi:hypothetical protein
MFQKAALSMISIVDLAGNSYPLPARGLSCGADIHTQLLARYGVRDVELFAKRARVDRAAPLDPDILSGAVAVAMVLCSEIAGAPSAFVRPADAGRFSIDRFSTLCFSAGGAELPGSAPDAEFDAASSDERSDGSADLALELGFLDRRVADLGLLLAAIREQIPLLPPLTAALDGDFGEDYWGIDSESPGSP